MSERDDMRGVLSNTICNASLYTKRAQPYLLGSDMSRVLDKTADNLIAAGYVKLPMSDATVERAAQVVHNFLNQNYPCGCGPDEMCPGNSYEATHIARAVLAAAVKEER